jgi:8-oxo-dGTP pyrophosphatase MutT (NUDIX family)|tara:strand:- start:1464 stop:2288 length:825 start_codon:yes stop_codon:yes gene_type:complete
MNVYCNNCGIKGHVYKDCSSPILSCGVLLCKKEEGEYKVLMINRKDSLCYIDFLRGKYNINDVEYIQILVDKMTINEKDKLMKNTFDDLWMSLWNLEELTKELVEKNDYKEGKRKYESLKMGIHRDKQLYQLGMFVSVSSTDYRECEWEFPKGRRNKHEKNKDCAIREVGEETNYMITEDYDMISNIIPLTEEFRGENRVKYKYLYYIGLVTNKEKRCEISEDNVNQKQEISDIGWFSKEESLSKIRDYHKSRERLIGTIYNLLEDLETDLIVL